MAATLEDKEVNTYARKLEKNNPDMFGIEMIAQHFYNRVAGRALQLGVNPAAAVVRPILLGEHLQPLLDEREAMYKRLHNHLEEISA